MAKPTSLAAQLKRDDEAEKKAQEAENAEFAAKPAAEGKVWARLTRPHYDSNNVLHMPGIVLLDADAVPKSAILLTEAQVAEQKAAEEAEDE